MSSISYVFRAVDGLGVKHKGEIEAESAAGVTDLLKGRGLIALEVKAKTKSMELSFDQFTRVTLEDLALMTRQLSTMISSGLSLMRALVECRIKPYYLHHGDLAPGTAHLRTSIEHGQALMRALRGRLSGLCQPAYVLDIPGGHGKSPIGPSYLEHVSAGGEPRFAVEDFNGRRHAYPPVAADG